MYGFFEYGMRYHSGRRSGCDFGSEMGRIPAGADQGSCTVERQADRGIFKISGVPDVWLTIIKILDLPDVRLTEIKIPDLPDVWLTIKIYLKKETNHDI